MIYVTHDQKEALAMGARIAVMQMGKVAQIGTPREVYRHRSRDLSRIFIGEINLISGEDKICGKSDEMVAATDVGDIRGQADMRVFRWGIGCCARFDPRRWIFSRMKLGRQIMSFAGACGGQFIWARSRQFFVELASGDQVKLIQYGAIMQHARPGDEVRLGFSQVVMLRDEAEDRDEAV